MNIGKLHKIAGREIIDYQFLLSVLSDYASPRDKITAWLQSGELVRVKKGLYVFGREVAEKPYSMEVLANLIYGPSAVSLQYALSYYGMIPERVTAITSVTNKRNKIFGTPVGDFTYRYLATGKYEYGIELVKLNEQNHCLMASPEKALCDYIHLVDHQVEFHSIDALEAYLLQDLRMDSSVLRSLRLKQLAELSLYYQDPRFEALLKFIKKR